METSGKTRAAAFVVAATVLGGIIAGLVVPRVMSQTRVQYGTWVGGDAATRRCVEGSVWVDDGPRSLASLPLVKDGASPYCVYRACFNADAIPEDGHEVNLPGMDPLFADQEVAWQDGWPPLEVWCGDASGTVPATCACRMKGDSTGSCEQQRQSDQAWEPAPYNSTLSKGNWRGGCFRSTCTVLAGRDHFPKECCVPQCDGKQCGPDGCGGTCGECQSVTNIDPAWTAPASCDVGRCCVEPPCTPERTPAPAGWLPPVQ